MAILTRAALKTFFETNDEPTQLEFADLIDSFLSLIDDSNLANGLKIKSISNDKIQILFDDAFLQITTDGDNFAEAGVFIDPDIFYAQSTDVWIALEGNAALNVGEIAIPADRKFRFFAGPTFVFSFMFTGGQFRVSFNIPTYADNIAALAGGLTANDIYKTATGELRITI